MEYEGSTGYAFHWTNKDCGYIHATGAYGQHILIDPELNLTVAFVGTVKAIPQDIPVKYIIKPTLKDGAERSYDGENYPALLDRTEKLSLLYEPADTFSPLEEKAGGQIYSAGENDAGIEGIRFGFSEDTVDFTMITENGSYTISSGKSSWTSGTADMSSAKVHGNCMDSENVVTNAKWLDDHTLQLTWFFTSMPYTDTLTFTFHDDSSQVQMEKVTNIGDDPVSCSFSAEEAAASADGTESGSADETAAVPAENESDLITGVYVIGKDLDAGDYYFRNTAQATVINLYSGEEDYAAAGNSAEQYLYGNETVSFTLEEGQVLVLDGAVAVSPAR